MAASRGSGDQQYSNTYNIFFSFIQDDYRKYKSLSWWLLCSSVFAFVENFVNIGNITSDGVVLYGKSG